MSSFSSILPCPACGRVAPFSHPKTNVTVCICGEVLHRREGDILLVKPFKKITAPTDCIQPGTTGKWQEQNFTVLGRVRLWLNEAVTNYWTVALDNGRLLYLVESYGLYAFYEKQSTADNVGYLDPVQLKVGNYRTFKDGQDYVLEKRDKCYQWEVEGELLLPECDNQFPLWDFSSTQGQHLEIVEFTKKVLTTYLVTYTSFTALELDKLQIQQTYTKEIDCEKCSQLIPIIAYPYSQSLACPNCKAHYAVNKHGNYQLLVTRNEIDETPNLSLGATGIIKNIDYKVIGATVKQEITAERSRWREYTLYNRQEGYAFLSEYDGHWMYVRQKGNAPVLLKDNNSEITFQNEPFKLFNYYNFRVIYAAGEFANNIYNDGEKTVREFISPPEMWIREKSADEGIEWFLGEHISGRKIEDAFKEGVVLPYTKGRGAIQPGSFINPGKIVLATILAIIALIAVHLSSNVSHSQKVIFENGFVFPDTAATFSEVWGPVNLSKQNRNVEVELSSPVDNSWVELDLTLVNTTTGEEFSLNEGLEYYHGYSDGENWTEGSNNGTAYFNSLPAGSYKIQVSGTRDITGGSYGWTRTMNVRLTYDVPNHRNFFICLGFLLLWPIINYAIIYNREKSRWMNSPLASNNYDN